MYKNVYMRERKSEREIRDIDVVNRSAHINTWQYITVTVPGSQFPSSGKSSKMSSGADEGYSIRVSWRAQRPSNKTSPWPCHSSTCSLALHLNSPRKGELGKEENSLMVTFDKYDKKKMEDPLKLVWSLCLRGLLG